MGCCCSGRNNNSSTNSTNVTPLSKPLIENEVKSSKTLKDVKQIKLEAKQSIRFKHIAKEADVVFKFLDSDGNGELSVEESLKLLSMVGLKPDPQKYREYYKTIAGSNGLLSFEAFCYMLSGSNKHQLFPDQSEYLQTVFELIDTDHTMSISPKELSHVFHVMGRSMTLEQAAAVVKKYDKNKNGAIDFDEFKNLMGNLDMVDLIMYVCAHRVKGELVEEEGQGQTKQLDVNKPTAVVVLGKKLDPDGNPTDILKVRMSKAIEVMNNMATSRNDVMIVTGGKVGGGGSEADVMKALALGKYGTVFEKELPNHEGKFVYRFGGVPEDSIVLEDKAQTTIENAFLVRQTLEKLGIKQVILVTSDFHMPRSREIFKRVLGMNLTESDIQSLRQVPLDITTLSPGRVEYSVFYEEDHPPLDQITRTKEMTFETFVMPHVESDIATLLIGKKVLRNNKP